MDKKRVLVVDDERDLTTLISDILESQGGFEVYVANSGKEAIEKITAFNPDIIFLDYVMPEVKGDVVLDFMKKIHPISRVSIVLMSGLGEMVFFNKQQKWKWLPRTDIVRGRGELPESLKWKKGPTEITRELGVKAYLPKPFFKETFLEVLMEVSESEKAGEA